MNRWTKERNSIRGLPGRLAALGLLPPVGRPWLATPAGAARLSERVSIVACARSRQKNGAGVRFWAPEPKNAQFVDKTPRDITCGRAATGSPAGAEGPLPIPLGYSVVGHSVMGYCVVGRVAPSPARGRGQGCGSGFGSAGSDEPMWGHVGPLCGGYSVGATRWSAPRPNGAAACRHGCSAERRAPRAAQPVEGISASRESPGWAWEASPWRL